MPDRTSQTAKYLRWGGLAAMLGALLVMVGAYWGKFLEAGSKLHEFTGEPAFVAAVGIGLTGALILVFGVFALASVQLDRARGWGLPGLVGAVTAAVMLVAGLFAQGSFFPSLAADAPGFLRQFAEGDATGPAGPAILANSLLQALGIILFGIATLRAGVFSKWAGAALILGALLITVPITGSNVVLFAALIWMGSQLFAGRVSDAQAKTSTTTSSVEHDPPVRQA